MNEIHAMRWLTVLSLAACLSASFAQDDLLGRGGKKSDKKPPTQSGNADRGGSKPQPPIGSGQSNRDNKPRPPINQGGSSDNRILPPTGSGQSNRDNKPRPPINQGGSSDNRNQPPIGSGQSNRDNKPRPPISSGGTSNNNDSKPQSNREPKPGLRTDDRDEISHPPIRSNDNLLSSRNVRQSKSGTVQYQGSNNIASRVRAPITITAPLIRQSSHGLPSQVLREEQIRVNSNRNHQNDYRSGYCAYNNNWIDNSFNYPFYNFNYGGSNCVFSPWYYYPNLPGYIDYSRCRFNRSLFTIMVNLDYTWDRNYRDGRNWDRDWNDRNWDRDSSSRELDRAISDIERVWDREDLRVLEDLLPRRGDVYVTMEDGYQYSLSSNDFYDMMADNISTTRTQRYSIKSVRTGRDGAKVIAEHEFTDPWNRRSVLYHRYTLVRERNAYVIAEFTCSPYRPAW